MILSSVCSEDELNIYREEADREASESGTICVRFLNRKSDVFHELCFSENLSKFLSAGYVPVRSIRFDEMCDENQQVSWHQYLTINVKRKVEVRGYGSWSNKDGFPHVQPPREMLERMVTIRLHLDDTSSENGALRVIPRSHLLGKLSSDEVFNYVDGKEEVCSCEAGDVVLMKPLVLHSSRRSEHPNRRRVVHFEYARSDDLDSELEWAEA